MSRKQMRLKPLNNLSTKAGFYAVEENFISVSFRYLSNNRRRNFEFFDSKRWREKAQALGQFFSFLQRLTNKHRLEIMRLPKDADCGFENLPFGTVNCTPNGYNTPTDKSISVFRFGDNGNGGDYRLLGFFESNSPVLYIIGFDFDYSAYQHE